jgi:hypothetical protein
MLSNCKSHLKGFQALEPNSTGESQGPEGWFTPASIQPGPSVHEKLNAGGIDRVGPEAVNFE